MIFSMCAFALFGLGCGGAELDYSGATCHRARLDLMKRIGPEFGKLIQAQALPVSPPKLFGCALTFTRIDEELPGEVLGEYGGNTGSHELALAIPDLEGRLVLQLPNTPPHRKTTVSLEIQLREVYGGGIPELLIQERATKRSERYQAIRIFMFALGVPTPREIFSQQLLIKTPEGIEVTPQWKIERFEEHESIIFEGGGEDRIFMWHEGTQRFALDLAASQRKLLKGKPSQQASEPSLRSPQSPNPTNSSKESETGKSNKTTVNDLLKSL